MKTRKVILSILMCLVLFGMTGCNSETNATTPAPTSEATTTAAATSAATSAPESQTETSQKDGSGLIGAEYFTGNYTALPDNGESYQFTVSYAAPENSDAHTLMLAFKEAMEFYSDGKITLTLYPNGQLGSDAEMIASCLTGDIDFVMQSGSTHVSFVPETAIFDTPFLLSGYDVEKIQEIILDSEFRDMYNEANERGGLVCLMVKCVDTMNLTSNRAVYSVEDLKGLKIRTAQSESRMAFWSALGANPTPLAFSELYMALQNGTVDAQDNVWANAVTSGAWEQQKYMIPTEHLRPSMDFTMGKEKFDSLPAEYQSFIKEICANLNVMDFDTSIKTEQEYKTTLEGNLELCEVSDEFRQEMIEAAADSINKTRETVNNDALYDTLERLLQN